MLDVSRECRARVLRLPRRRWLQHRDANFLLVARTGCAWDGCKFVYHSSAALVKLKIACTTEKSAIVSSGANVVIAGDTGTGEDNHSCPCGRRGGAAMVSLLSGSRLSGSRHRRSMLPVGHRGGITRPASKRSYFDVIEVSSCGPPRVSAVMPALSEH